MRGLLSSADLTRDAALGLFALAAGIKQRSKAGQRAAPLAGKTFALIFEKPSLRTRVTFEVGLEPDEEAAAPALADRGNAPRQGPQPLHEVTAHAGGPLGDLLLDHGGERRERHGRDEGRAAEGGGGGARRPRAGRWRGS